MTPAEFFAVLTGASSTAEVSTAIATFEGANIGAIQWKPFGRENNRGTVEASTDPGRSLVERVTNGIDAVLEAEHVKRNGRPLCRSPKEAASAWLNVPDGGLSEMSPQQRRQLAQRVTVQLLTGESKDSRVVSVRDTGIGLTAEQMPLTILSLNETNKSRKLYLAGAYGQGGSSTLAISRYTFIASRPAGHPTVAFTLVSFYEPPLEEDKLGRYVYLNFADAVLEATIPEAEFPAGTLVKHFGYDFSDYTSPFGPTSTYGLLNRILFDPVMPVWLDNPLNNQRRVIKGSRNALNGAVDEGDDTTTGTVLAHKVEQYFTSLGQDYGRIGIEYWVLPRPTKANKKPNAAYVHPGKPIVLTVNGQNHSELSASHIRKDADLPFLTQRLIVHVDCNQLTPGARRLLFVSNREEARRGAMRQLIIDEVSEALSSDDELKRLNNEARDQGFQEQDEEAKEQMRREVSKLLRLHGVNIDQPVGPTEGAGDGGKPTRPTRTTEKKLPETIQIHEPPTYIRWLAEEAEEPVTFFANQRRYMRIQTDAASTYHNARDPKASRVNIIVTGEGIAGLGSTPLKGGRMRAIFEGNANAVVGSQGTVRVELSRTGMPVLADERKFTIVATPTVKPGTRLVAVPEWEVIRVDGPDAPFWTDLGWPEDVNLIASTAQMEQGVLKVYYSAKFPRFHHHETLFERRNPALAASFRLRYEIWLAVHSLLMHQDQQQAPTDTPKMAEDPEDDTASELRDRQERVRIATLSVLFAVRETEQPTVGQPAVADTD